MRAGHAGRIPPTFILPAVAWTALWLAYVLPSPLDEPFASWILGLTHTGGLIGVALIAIATSVVSAFRAPRTKERVARELATHAVILAIFLGGGALANEYLLKPAFRIPRPNIEQLAESGILGMSSETFYESMPKDQRRSHLAATVGNDSSLGLGVGVRDHWAHEAGYSFPSGHSFSAMLLATYFLLLGTTLSQAPWRRARLLLPIWAILVAWSRVLLGVHRPADVIWGGLIGLVLGAAAAALHQQLGSIGGSSSDLR